MTDLKPEDRALTIVSAKLSSFPDHGARDGAAVYKITGDELGVIRDVLAARAEGRRSPGETGFEGLPERLTDQCADAGPCPHSPVAYRYRWAENSLRGWVYITPDERAKFNFLRSEDGEKWTVQALGVIPDGGEAVHTGQLRDELVSSSGSGRDEAALPEADTFEALVAEVMADTWNEICSDTECHPTDIEQLGRKRLGFRPRHWSSFIAGRLRSSLAAHAAAPPPPPVAELRGDVVRLVKASRRMAKEGPSLDSMDEEERAASDELYEATEAFADSVPSETGEGE